MKIGDRVSIVGTTVSGAIIDGSHYAGFVDMRRKVLVRWDKPRGKNRIISETMHKSNLVKLYEPSPAPGQRRARARA